MVICKLGNPMMKLWEEYRARNDEAGFDQLDQNHTIPPSQQGWMDGWMVLSAENPQKVNREISCTHNFDAESPPWDGSTPLPVALAARPSSSARSFSSTSSLGSN